MGCRQIRQAGCQKKIIAEPADQDKHPKTDGETARKERKSVRRCERLWWICLHGHPYQVIYEDPPRRPAGLYIRWVRPAGSFISGMIAWAPHRANTKPYERAVASQRPIAIALLKT